MASHIPNLQSVSALRLTSSTDPLGPDAVLAARGDPDAFERLYRATVDRVYALVRRMAGAPAADDLTQEVYLRAWNKLHTFRGDAAFTTWLHRLAVNLVLAGLDNRELTGRSLALGL